MDVERAANAEVDEIRAEMAKAEGVAVDQIRQFEQQVHAVQEESRREVRVNLIVLLNGHY